MEPPSPTQDDSQVLPEVPFCKRWLEDGEPEGGKEPRASQAQVRQRLGGKHEGVPSPWPLQSHQRIAGRKSTGLPRRAQCWSLKRENPRGQTVTSRFLKGVSSWGEWGEAEEEEKVVAAASVSFSC